MRTTPGWQAGDLTAEAAGGHARRRDLLVSLALLASAGVVAVVPDVGLPSALREVVVLVYCLTAPGWSLVRLLSLERWELVVGTSVALSVAMVIVVSVVMVDLGAWHPYGTFYLVLCLTALAAPLKIAVQ